jgi:DNA-binding MarR family transcriptional regulator
MQVSSSQSFKDLQPLILLFIFQDGANCALTIDQLLKAGLVAKMSDPEDQRSVLIKLTEEGFTLIEAALGDHIDTQNRLLPPVSNAKLSRLNKLLELWLKTLEEK